ncbi:hypothetical protein BRD01_16050 [Halobacteriales archaeon QS_8_65_32]|nr:MAG: hypothetical protein BRD01_16050 [Halobacteriales archaeon QS_8_65_32]
MLVLAAAGRTRPFCTPDRTRNDGASTISVVDGRRHADRNRRDASGRDGPFTGYVAVDPPTSKRRW